MRILCLGDSPFIKTGFGIVNRVAVDHLLSLGHELVVIGSLDGSERSEPGITFIPAGDPADRMGLRRLDAAVTMYKPQAVHMVGDMAMTSVWNSHESIKDVPKFAYTPVEGSPTNWSWAALIKATKNLTLYTCSLYGQIELARNGIVSGMVYHGVADDFTPLSPAKRAAWREAIGWDGKFIVMSVAQNVRRKQWPRLFEAMRLVVKHHPEAYLYAHTVPYMDHWLGGWNLPVLAGEMGIWDHIIFPPKYTSIHHAVPAQSDGVDPGLADLYGMADIFAMFSQVEGFGLPYAEAMASGLPVMGTNYATTAEVIGNAGILVDPYDWEVDHSHAKYANVNPQDIATQIVRLLKSEPLRKSNAKRGIERAKAFTWDDYRNVLTEWARENTETPSQVE